MIKNNREKVFEIFKDYYGEDYVELQDIDILVYFPKVTVTNENDQSIDIEKLFVKVPIDSDGKMVGYFKMNKAKYTLAQWRAGYIHSHVPSLTTDCLSDFKDPCMGTGPIRTTCNSLNCEYNEDLWQLFCCELDLYVRTESIYGIPYVRLAIVTSKIQYENKYRLNLNINSFKPSYCYEGGLTGDFFNYLLSHSDNFKFTYCGNFKFAETFKEVLIKITNMFIYWFNSLDTIDRVDRLEEAENLLIQGKFKDGEFFKNTISAYAYNNKNPNNYIGEYICTFKEKIVPLVIDTNSDTDPNFKFDKILDPSYAATLMYKMLDILNLRYGNARENKNPYSKFEYPIKKAIRIL